MGRWPCARREPEIALRQQHSAAHVKQAPAGYDVEVAAHRSTSGPQDEGLALFGIRGQWSVAMHSAEMHMDELEQETIVASANFMRRALGTHE